MVLHVACLVLLMVMGLLGFVEVKLVHWVPL